MNKPHVLHLYQKPALGDGFIRYLMVYNYRHTIAAIGGFDTASFDVAVRSRDEGQQFLDQYLGNRVAIYVDNPVEPIWEGFINRMTFSAGGVEYTISLDEMANRIVATWTNPSLSATNPQTSATSNDTDSQGIYGIKQETIDLGLQSNTSNAPTNLRTTVITQRAWPKTSITQGQGSGLLHIECLGFYHTLGWERYSDTSTADIALSTYITTLLAAVANGTTFFDNSVTSDVSTNALTIRRESIRGETIWDRMLMTKEVGDGTSYWVIGVSPTNFQTGVRSLYYRLFNNAIEYTARQSDGLRIRNLYGQLVPPWTVRPDAGIRVSDMLIGWNSVGDNPTETYINVIDYDANRQIATWRGDDDTTAEGAFQFRRHVKAHSKRFGATRRFV